VSFLMTPFWVSTTGQALAQGDLLADCPLPVFRLPPQNLENGQPQDALVALGNLIVVTQSCDLENDKTDFVALCQIHALPVFESINPEFAGRGKWETVRKGRVEGLHLLASPTNPADNREALVVDFGMIVSLPTEYLKQHAERLGPRWRLQSPFLEHFSQAFARFFMRVGLPSTIPPFT
jgi:hypothetical protein